jgi:hypothetical protein
MTHMTHMTHIISKPARASVTDRQTARQRGRDRVRPRAFRSRRVGRADSKGLQLRSVSKQFFIFCKMSCQGLLDNCMIEALGVKPANEDVNARNFLAFCLA